MCTSAVNQAQYIIWKHITVVLDINKRRKSHKSALKAVTKIRYCFDTHFPGHLLSVLVMKHRDGLHYESDCINNNTDYVIQNYKKFDEKELPYIFFLAIVVSKSTLGQ